MISGVTMRINIDEYLMNALKEDITQEDVSTNAVMPEPKQHQNFPAGQKLLQPAGKGRNAPQIANEDEKSHKGQKQGIVHCP